MVTISDLVRGLASVLLTLVFSPTERIWTSRKEAPLLLLWAEVLGLVNTLAGHSWPFQPQSTYSAESMAMELWGCSDQGRVPPCVVVGTAPCWSSLSGLAPLPVVLSSLQNLVDKLNLRASLRVMWACPVSVGEGSRAALGRN